MEQNQESTYINHDKDLWLNIARKNNNTVHNQNSLQGMFSNLQSTSFLKVVSQKIHNSTVGIVYAEFDTLVTAKTGKHIKTCLFECEKDEVKNRNINTIDDNLGKTT
jgi:hypothetical protein